MMTFRIKIVNSKGTHFSGRYATHKEAERIMRQNIDSDRRMNDSGSLNARGELIHIRNKYSVVKG